MISISNLFENMETKKKVVIIAPTGMLGSMLYKELKETYTLVLVYRDEEKLRLLERTYGEALGHEKIQFDARDAYQDFIEGFTQDSVGPRTKALFEKIGTVDAVINAAGVIKPHSLKDPALTLFVNGAFPHVLSQQYGLKLIQITTDCVFCGTSGAPYDEHSAKSPNDLYGISKMLGEPKEKSLVLRTSIIGPEIGEGSSLIAWFKKQDGQTIKGFTTHFWNGITTKEFAKICDKIISHRDEYPKNGLFHIFGNDVSKFSMVQAFKKKYNINVTIEPAEPPVVDRRLRTAHDLNKKLMSPTFEERIEGL